MADREKQSVMCAVCRWEGDRRYVWVDDPMDQREGFGRCPACGGALVHRPPKRPRGFSKLASLPANGLRFVLVLAVLGAVPVSAEPLKIPRTFDAAAAVSDVYFTILTFQVDGHEVGPAYAWLDQEPVALAAFSALVEVAQLWALHKFVGKKHPKIEHVILYVTAARRVRAALKGHCIHRETRAGRDAWAC